ncbi:MAG: alpha/beta fold hydrolase [Gammaproteobacteria bacterium]|nr:alpha/beta fold hydrolase [Gammaproteobacteria bacterium]
MRKFKIILLPLLALFQAGCSTIEVRHTASGISDVFEFPQTESFQSYTNRTSNYLWLNWQNRLATEPDWPKNPGVEKIAQYNSPGMSSPGENCTAKQNGIVLIHGLYDSPYVMHDLQEYFQSRCFYTMSLLLPGHGTRPGDLLNLSYREWKKATTFSIQRMAQQVDNVFIAGFSTGGALAVNYANDPQREDGIEVKGLFLLAPALDLRAKGAALILADIVSWVPGQKFNDVDYIKYESLTTNSVRQIIYLANETRERLAERQLNIPAFIVVAENDYTIPAKTTIDLFKKDVFSENSILVKFTPNSDNDDIRIYSTNLPDKSICRNFKEERIIECDSSFEYIANNGKEYTVGDFSHMALTLKPDDPHYGFDGDYRYCLHYSQDNDAVLRDQCLNQKAPFCYGERSAFSHGKSELCAMKGRAVVRLTSNPLFPLLVEQMDIFLGKVIK